MRYVWANKLMLWLLLTQRHNNVILTFEIVEKNVEMTLRACCDEEEGR